jgi:hypothetical protein
VRFVIERNTGSITPGQIRLVMRFAARSVGLDRIGTAPVRVSVTTRENSGFYGRVWTDRRVVYMNAAQHATGLDWVGTAAHELEHVAQYRGRYHRVVAGTPRGVRRPAVFHEDECRRADRMAREEWTRDGMDDRFVEVGNADRESAERRVEASRILKGPAAKRERIAELMRNWESKARRARSALARLRRRLSYYDRRMTLTPASKSPGGAS